MYLAWGPPLFSDILFYVSQHRSLTYKSLISYHLEIHVIGTERRAHVRTTMFNIWRVGAMDKTSGKRPHVKLSLLRRFSLQIRPKTA